ncbi:element excision factor XisI family protein [Pseudanabaena sp. ABRG5-3]|uniref:element excision factor XisI family protein n=1 Tax=Pseudanabaena sp. ABRG5-3 TaxID=685565 RepID=UPI000DC71111|nr:element excision factor XisI family protein [Pseudanabaena sp. ABRG5-3]BBC25815.1 fdxN element excision controlling factor protein [Pseudanabaena sp. ABRG5-3]
MKRKHGESKPQPVLLITSTGCNDKIWIHYDGIEDSVTEDLVAAGVPKEKIVLGFYPPDVRVHTGYAVV